MSEARRMRTVRDEEDLPTRRQGVLSGRVLLAIFVVAELLCLAALAMIIFT